MFFYPFILVSDTARMEDTVLTAMVPVDPFQLPQEEPLALTVGKERQEQQDRPRVARVDSRSEELYIV